MQVAPFQEMSLSGTVGLLVDTIFVSGSLSITKQNWHILATESNNKWKGATCTLKIFEKFLMKLSFIISLEMDDLIYS